LRRPITARRFEHECDTRERQAKTFAKTQDPRFLFDDQRRNAYMNFTVWGYARFYWMDDFDPEFFHLGKTVGEMQQSKGGASHVYL